MKYILLVLLVMNGLSDAFALKPDSNYVAFPDSNYVKYREEKIEEVEDNIIINSWIYTPDEKQDNGVLLILSGGDGGNMSYWVTHATLLCQYGFTVITYDYRGFGHSSFMEIEESHLFYDEFVADLKAVTDFSLKRFPGKHIGYLGYSMGSLISMLAFQEYRDKIDLIITEGLLFDVSCTTAQIEKIKEKKIIIDTKFNLKPEFIVGRIEVPALNFKGSLDNTINDCMDMDFLTKKGWETVNYEGGHLAGMSAMRDKYYGDMYVKSIIEFLRKSKLYKW